MRGCQCGGRGGPRHCEERSDVAIQTEKAVTLDCRASLAMTGGHLPWRPLGGLWHESPSTPLRGENVSHWIASLRSQ
ncbi:MAG: hypothetical protein LBT00_13560 [Spirochaetaceae bacterium]|nr:hypothetical protein [Spirochaetaceae bacterium]